MSSRGDDEVVWALSGSDGKELWVMRLGPATRQGMPQGSEGPACTPTVDGERLYVVGLGGDLACLRVNDGKIIWHLSLQRDFGGRVPTLRFNESPLIDGDKVICTPRRPRRNYGGPRQVDGQDDLEEPDARRCRRRPLWPRRRSRWLRWRPRWFRSCLRLSHRWGRPLRYCARRGCMASDWTAQVVALTALDHQAMGFLLKLG